VGHGARSRNQSQATRQSSSIQHLSIHLSQLTPAFRRFAWAHLGTLQVLEMNEALCDFCKPLFEGGVDGNEEDDSHNVLVVKREFLHHNSTRDLHDCAQAECLLCAAVWNSASRKLQVSWLTADSEVRFQVTHKWLHMKRERWELSIQAWSAPEEDSVECMFDLAGKHVVLQARVTKSTILGRLVLLLPEAENTTNRRNRQL